MSGQANKTFHLIFPSHVAAAGPHQAEQIATTWSLWQIPLEGKRALNCVLNQEQVHLSQENPPWDNRGEEKYKCRVALVKF